MRWNHAAARRASGFPEASKWKAKYGGLDVSDARQLRTLEEENAKLKRLVADLTLDKTMLQDVLRKNV